MEGIRDNRPRPIKPGLGTCVKWGFGDEAQQAEQKGERLKMAIRNPQCATVGNGKVWAWVWRCRPDGRGTVRRVQCGTVRYGAVDGSWPGGDAVRPWQVGAASWKLGRHEVLLLGCRTTQGGPIGRIAPGNHLHLQIDHLSGNNKNNKSR